MDPNRNVVASGHAARRTRFALIPNVSLVVRDPVTLQQLTEFLLKGLSAVMLRLIPDVFDNLADLRVAYGKCPVTTLPMELMQRGSMRAKLVRKPQADRERAG